MVNRKTCTFMELGECEKGLHNQRQHEQSRLWQWRFYTAGFQREHLL